MLGALLGLGLALAVPDAVLGPSGPTWFGPHPPTSLGQGTPWKDLIIVVSPLDGHLYLQERDALYTLRVWDGTGWTVDGAPLTETWPIRDELDYQLVNGTLRAVNGYGGQTLMEYDDEGRLTLVLWPDGRRLIASYTEDGRVKSLIGPGTNRWLYNWGSAVQVTDESGQRYVVDVKEQSDGRQQIIVEDTLSRRVYSEYDADGRLHIIQDPRGSLTTLSRSRLALTLEGSAGRLVVYTNELGQAIRLEEAASKVWEWSYDQDGQLTTLMDPSGRLVRWEYDDWGRVRTISQASIRTNFDRDEAGRVCAIRSGSGNAIYLSRDIRGYVTSITDAVGNQYSIERYSGGLPLSVSNTDAGRWTLGVDLLGRPDAIRDPTGRLLSVYRGPSGLLNTLQDNFYGDIQLKRDLLGRLNRIEDSTGRSWSMLRDRLGGVIQITHPDRRQTRIHRDVLGEITAFESEELVTIRRDGVGRPTKAGPLTWHWGSFGLAGVQGPVVDVRFGRGPAGRLSSVESGELWVHYSRDDLGNVSTWEGVEGRSAVQRDLAGNIVAESGEQVVTLMREPTGLLSEIKVGDWLWHRQMDAASRLIRFTGPHGLRLGFVRDQAGRIVLSRLKSGALLLRRWLSGSVVERIQDAGGETVGELMTVFDNAGRITQQQGLGRPREDRTYGPGGELRTILTEAGLIFERSGSTSFGPGEAMVLYEPSGRLLEARPATHLPDWGIASEMLSAYWSPSGLLSELVGDHGVIRLHHDAFGRLAEVEELDRGSWKLAYDIRGRLWKVTPPDGPVVSLLWSPSGELLSIGERALLYDLEGGVQAWATDAHGGSALWLRGGYTWLQSASSQDWPRLTVDGHIALFKGGPTITSDGALEPISGLPTLLRTSMPWTLNGAPRAAMDPAPLMPQSVWHDVPSLLADLGVLTPIIGSDWAACPSLPSELPWPDPAVRPPLGPDPTWLPLREDPFTMALICAMVQQQLPLSQDWMRSVFLHEEAEAVDIPVRLLRAPAGLVRE